MVLRRGFTVLSLHLKPIEGDSRMRPTLLSVMILCVCLFHGYSSGDELLEVREYEDSVIIAEGKHQAIRFDLERDAGTRSAGVRIGILFDPYGDPYVAKARESRLPMAVDWGVETLRVGGRSLGPYMGDTAQRPFERWSDSESGPAYAALELQRAWLDPLDGRALVLETARVVVYPAEFYRRSIDIRVRLVNVSEDEIELPADAGFLVRFDSERPRAGFRTPDNETRRAPFRYNGPWLAGASMSLSRLKIVGIALFNDVSMSRGGEAKFTVPEEGTIHMAVRSGPETVAPGERTEWSARIFCFADDLPAKAIQDSYMGFLTGRTW